MLSDEERELIEEIQKGNKIGIYELIRTFKREGIENFITVRRKYIDIMINLIEKQTKEIEERGDSIDESTMLKQIKNKLDEKNIPIETLLAEFERLEDIEDKKVQIEYNNVFNKGVKSVENKIKAKIEEKFLEAKGLYERGVQPQAQYTMKLLRDLEKSLLEKE